MICAEIGMDSNSKIHIGDHVASGQQRLLYTAKDKLVKSGVFKYAWIQHGDVSVRKGACSKIIKIKSEEHILNLI